jgi:hypothetical protein
MIQSAAIRLSLVNIVKITYNRTRITHSNNIISERIIANKGIPCLVEM